MNDFHPMRTLMLLAELAAARGMNAVKAALSRRIETDSGDESLIDQWGMMDDLWITGSGGLMLYRAVQLKQPWEKTLKSKGHAYWSTSNGGAAAYDGDAIDLKDTVDVKIVAELPATAGVDWGEIWESILHYHDRGENELRLHDVRLIVRHISVEGTEVESPWIGKVMTA
jgi:hypothetical protein